MNVMTALGNTDLEERAQNVLHGVRDLGVDTILPASTERLRDLAASVRPDRYRKQVSALEGDFTKHVQRLERKLERKVKRLPIDTPLDRRRRRRARRRGAAGTVVVVSVAGVLAYVWWRARRPDASSSDEVESTDRGARLEHDRDRGTGGAGKSGPSGRVEASTAGANGD